MLVKIGRILRGQVTKPELYIYIFVLLVAAYVVLALALPPNQATLKKYDLTESELRLLSLTLIVPLIIIWFTALYGYLRFKAYAEVIKTSNEGTSFNHLADGLMVLAFGMPVTAIISSVLGEMMRQHNNLTPVATICRNYISLLFFIVAFVLIAKGANGLMQTLRPQAPAYPRYGGFGVLVLSSVFTAMVIGRPESGNSGSIYYLPDWLIVLTLVIPYLFVWCTGLLAAYHLYVYKSRVRGTIYKQAFNNLALGIAAIVVISIVLQFLTTITEQLNRLHLTPILLILYVLVGLYAVGYGLVARGAKKLRKIEEV
ncbi:MAG TPA: hypothetical protein VLE73_03265 [Candidatus Saccharimonadales bacterium]|nr:hypothetical protein [Candidatus Saccharimonadales bacterium]